MYEQVPFLAFRITLGMDLLLCKAITVDQVVLLMRSEELVAAIWSQLSLS